MRPRSQLHDEAEGGEQDVGEGLDALEHRLAGLSDAGQAEADDDRDQQDRQHLTLGEGAEEGVRDDVHEEFDEAGGSGLCRVLRRH